MPDIRMPSLGADMEAGTLLEWKVKPGDTVTRGQVVALVETEKATMELESFEAGEVEVLLIEVGHKVPVGTPLARLRSRDESAAAAGAAPGPAPPLPSPAATSGPVATAIAAATPTVPPRRVRSSPAARRAARERGLDLDALVPTGPDRAVVLRDVEAVASRATAARAVAAEQRAEPAPGPVSAPFARPAPARQLPTVSVFGPMRDAIAAAMSRSKREIPHFYLSQTISLRRALAWLAESNAKRPLTERLLPGVLLLKAVVEALWEVPELNGFWIESGFRPAEVVHLGTAISLRGGGVLAPAILDADQKSLDQIMVDLRDLVSRARAGRLRSSEMSSPTITVTSLGERGCEAVWGVINPPQVAIVGFGAFADRPWVEDGQIAVHPVVTATLSVDHRVCDGHRGGLFLSAVDHLLQEPDKL